MKVKVLFLLTALSSALCLAQSKKAVLIVNWEAICAEDCNKLLEETEKSACLEKCPTITQTPASNPNPVEDCREEENRPSLRLGLANPSIIDIVELGSTYQATTTENTLKLQRPHNLRYYMKFKIPTGKKFSVVGIISGNQYQDGQYTSDFWEIISQDLKDGDLIELPPISKL